MVNDRTDLHNLCRSLWLRGALDQPAEFERVRNILMRQCYVHVGRMEFRELLSLTRAVHWVGPLCREEPYVSKYEQAIGKLGTLAAYAASQLREFETVYRQLASVQIMLDSSARRRENLGFVAWPFSEIRLNMIRVLADCKMQDTDRDRDRMYTPEQLYTMYEQLYSRITAFIEEHNLDEREVRAHQSNLAETSSALLKMCARFTPQLLIDQIQRFNRRFGANVALGVGHFRTSRALGGVWYWDFEITKLYLADELTLKDLDFCHERLLKAAQAEAPEAYIFHQAIRLEYFWLAKALRRQDKPGLEVVSG